MKNRLKSLLWRVGMMGLAFALSALAEQLSVLKLSSELTTLLGLVLGELSKYINKKLTK